MTRVGERAEDGRRDWRNPVRGIAILLSSTGNALRN